MSAFYESAALANINRNLGNTGVDADDVDALCEEVYVLAFDAIVDAGGSADVAQELALKLSQAYAG